MNQWRVWGEVERAWALIKPSNLPILSHLLQPVADETGISHSRCWEFCKIRRASRILPAEDRGTILLATATAMDAKGGRAEIRQIPMMRETCAARKAEQLDRWHAGMSGMAYILLAGAQAYSFPRWEKRKGTSCCMFFLVLEATAPVPAVPHCTVIRRWPCAVFQ